MIISTEEGKEKWWGRNGAISNVSMLQFDSGLESIRFVVEGFLNRKR